MVMLNSETPIVSPQFLPKARSGLDPTDTASHSFLQCPMDFRMFHHPSPANRIGEG